MPIALLLCATTTLFATRLAVAADSKTKKTETVISIEGMHCAGCAKKVATKLQAVKRVASAKVDAKTGIATVVPAKTQTVSPKSLWEAVEAAGYKPTKLAGPGGTFTKKPKS
ncbi:MAG: heavy metal-associated domain-containing protein [Planctomycetaceae bacterium]